MQNVKNRAAELYNIASNGLIVLLLGIFLVSKIIDFNKNLPKSNFELIRYSDDFSLYPRIVFNPKINLNPQFTPNTKQIFVFLCVNYKTINEEQKEQNNSEMVWWKIIKQEDSYENKILNKNFRSIWSFSKTPVEVELQLRGSVQQNVGAINQVVYFSKKISSKNFKK